MKPSKEILLDLSKYMNQIQIADHYGVAKSTVSNWFASYSIETKFTKHHEREARSIWELYHRKNLSQVEVAKELGMTKRTLVRKMQFHGIGRRKHSSKDRYPKEILTEKRLKELRSKGWTLRMIGNRLGVSYGTVKNYLRKYNIK